jgi:hypothetical protein
MKIHSVVLQLFYYFKKIIDLLTYRLGEANGRIFATFVAKAP